MRRGATWAWRGSRVGGRERPSSAGGAAQAAGSARAALCPAAAPSDMLANFDAFAKSVSGAHKKTHVGATGSYFALPAGGGLAWRARGLRWPARALIRVLTRPSALLRQ